MMYRPLTLMCGHDRVRSFVDRRTFLIAGGAGLCSLATGMPLMTSAAPTSFGPTPTGRARSTILFFLSGGASHIDTWDLKPHAPEEYRGPFEPIETSAPGVVVCEHLPLLARQMHHVAVVRSVGDHGRGTGDHHAGYYYHLTGHAPDPSFHRLLNNRTPQETDWPFMGATVAYKRPPHPHLPSLITMPHKPGAPRYTRPGQFAARLGIKHDPLYVDGNPDRPLEFTAPALELSGDVSVERLQSRRALLQVLDDAGRRLDRSAATGTYHTHQQKAFSLLASQQTKEAFDLTREPESVRRRYGETINGMSLLMARRLVEAEVPFVAVFWKGDPKRAEKLNCKSGGGWDTHGNNFVCLKEMLLPEFDRAFSALIEDLAGRGLLHETLLLVTSEMGRRPRIGDRRSGGVQGAGRDHWPQCQSVLLAGGGIQGGQAFGSSDKLAEYPAEKPLTPGDVTRTVYHAMGIDDLEAVDPQGRPFSLLDEGEPIVELF